MNVFIVIAIAVAMVGIFAVLLSKSNQRDKANNAVLSELWQKLRSEILEVSLLVAKTDPENKAAHELVLNAAQCLVFPNVGAHTIVTASMISNRYQDGFQYLAQARQAIAKPSA